MKRPVDCSAHAYRARSRFPRGYTLVEVLVATTLTLILMGVVVTIFGSISRSVHETRRTLEMTGALRDAKEQLRRDLEGLTVPVFPPRKPEDGEGYLEIAEGTVGTFDAASGTVIQPYDVAVNQDTGQPDTTVTDFDDILMFTTRSPTAPFVGRYRNGTTESYEAEIAYFVRGRTLYRRVLLISPQTMSDMDDNHDGNVDPSDNNGFVDSVDTGGVAFHALYDVSARPEFDPTGSFWGWIPNTLGDLTKRENRYAHRVFAMDVPPPVIHGFPYQISRWGQLGLPTLCETSHPNWMGFAGAMGWVSAATMPSVTPQATIDLWSSTPHPWPEVDPVTGTMVIPPHPPAPAPPRFMGPRVAEDVILTNVVGFDVKVWDPGAPVFQYPIDPASSTGDAAILPGDPGYSAIMTSVIGGANPSLLIIKFGAYVDMGYDPRYSPAFVASNLVLVAMGAPQPVFSLTNYDWGQAPPSANWGPSSWLERVYDTWSTHYEHDWVDVNGDGIPQALEPGNQFFDAKADIGDNGLDDGLPGVDDDGDGTVDEPGEGNGIVDDAIERETQPPYPFPLRGIQIKIRTYEPDSRQVREVTVVHDFLPK